MDTRRGKRVSQRDICRQLELLAANDKARAQVDIYKTAGSQPNPRIQVLCGRAVTSCTRAAIKERPIRQHQELYNP